MPCCTRLHGSARRRATLGIRPTTDHIRGSSPYVDHLHTWIEQTLSPLALASPSPRAAPSLRPRAADEGPPRADGGWQTRALVRTQAQCRSRTAQRQMLVMRLNGRTRPRRAPSRVMRLGPGENRAHKSAHGGRPYTVCVSVCRSETLSQSTVY